mmetsp:Transcript_703/g.1503  ORF Transcript_703/g.1503 Transcript_703/m.1503 type:complete len:403 (-) Transcript_703:110-1318(-)
MASDAEDHELLGGRPAPATTAGLSSGIAAVASYAQQARKGGVVMRAGGLVLLCCTAVGCALAFKRAGKPMSSTRVSLYRPIFCMHGIGGDPIQSCAPTCKVVEARHPGTLCIPIDAKACNGRDSIFNNMNSMTANVREFILDTISRNPGQFEDGFNLVCHSQGGLLCRALISWWDDHKIKTFVSLAGPQQGVDGFARLQATLPEFKALTEHIGFYTSTDQEYISFTGYWKDMAKYDTYQRFSKFLAVLNNESPEERCASKGSSLDWHCDKPGCQPVSFFSGCAWPPGHANFNKNLRLQRNFAALEHAVFCGSPDEEVIVPWQSTLWGYYAEGNTSASPHATVLNYSDTIIGRHNLVPLQEMIDAGKVTFCELQQVKHTDWILWTSDAKQVDRVMSCYLSRLK